MFANPFFHLKIIYVIYVKTGSLDLADFATTRHLIHWWFLAVHTTVWATVGISRPAQKKNPPKSAGCGISGKAPWADRWHIADITAWYANGRPNHCAKCHSRQIRCQSHSEIRRIWWISFHIDGCGTLRTVALRRLIFKQKKGSSTLV
jgi:hypothetical protein